MREAMFYEKKENDMIQCHLCPHECTIAPERVGRCNIRKNDNGTLVSLAYGEISSYALDPIEKKPLSRYMQGSYIFSVGFYGCNFSCKFCQNYHIALERPKTFFVSPEQLVQKAKDIANNIGIAYTYNEPLINYEYVYACAKKAHQENLINVVVTNGFINPKPLEKLLPYIDAFNIDLKAYNNEFYKNICSGELNPVMKTIQLAVKKSHVEVTLLLIEGLNDDLEELEEMFRWLGSLDKNLPLHISRYFPQYKMTRPKTRVAKLIEVQKIARKYLQYVYLGNV